MGPRRGCPQNQVKQGCGLRRARAKRAHKKRGEIEKERENQKWSGPIVKAALDNAMARGENAVTYRVVEVT